MLAFEECCTKHKKVILIKAKENQKYKSQMPLRKTEETEKGGDGGAAERQRCTEVLSIKRWSWKYNIIRSNN